ncbi:MAG TPA: hypothetical protein VFG03_14855 [Telluria sp.]|nr:hypothetical protein [Telluria sp.]
MTGDPAHPPQRAGQAASLLCAGAVLAAAWSYPLGGAWLLGAALLVGLLLWRWPQAWLVLVPAALPLLDLAPWTGRFYFDEFDCLLAATVAVRGWRVARPAAPAISPATGTALLLLVLSTLVSAAIGAWPFPPPGLNGFSHYYSPYNGLRMAKGLAWAWLLWPLLREELQRDVANTQRRFALGMLLGALGAALAVVWERAAFPGLFNFADRYRVVGMFSAMHVGGACIEAYFAMTLPFVAWWTLSARGAGRRLAGALVFALAAYGLAVTYARAGYVAAGLGMAVLAFGLWARGRTALPGRQLARALLLFALLAVLAWTVLQGDAMRRRYADSERDLKVRAAHWLDALYMMDDSPATVVFGLGIGSYPRSYFIGSGEGIHPAFSALDSEAGQPYLVLAGGAPLYVEQMVRLAPRRRYVLRFRARSADKEAELALPLCEKWMLYSARCQWQTFHVGDTGGQWRAFAGEFDSGTLGQAPGRAPRPLKLAVFNTGDSGTVDAGRFSLRADDGRELLRNGDFGAGMDHWFFSGDNHLPWHLENSWLQLLFEQGALGVLAFGALCACAAAAIVQGLRARRPGVPALAAALAAFFALSLVDSLFDFPRLGLLFYLIMAQALYSDKKTA